MFFYDFYEKKGFSSEIPIYSEFYVMWRVPRACHSFVFVRDSFLSLYPSLSPLLFTPSPIIRPNHHLKNGHDRHIGGNRLAPHVHVHVVDMIPLIVWADQTTIWYGHEHKDTLGEIVCCISCTCGWHISIDCLGPDGTVQFVLQYQYLGNFPAVMHYKLQDWTERNKIDNVFYLFDFLYETKAGPIIQYTV